MPIEDIAAELGVTTRAVDYTLARALRKLKDTGTYTELLDLIQARHIHHSEPGGHCISAECNREWINTWSPAADDSPRTTRAKQRQQHERGTSDRGGFMRTTSTK
jgi:hypothetical protein